MNNPTYRRARGLLEADIQDELVALDPEQGMCFGFNSVASSVWRSLEDPRTFEQLHDGLLNEYDVEPAQCRLELQELLDDLEVRGLITAS